MADALNAFSNVLTGNAEIVGMGASGVQIKNRNSSKTAKADYPTWEQLGGLIHEIDATKKRIADLEERRREMGI